MLTKYLNITQLFVTFMVVALPACTTLSSSPSRVDAHFGEAVREMRTAQTLDNSKRKHPNADPILSRDGKKVQSIFNTTYRGDILTPAPVVVNPDFQIRR